MGTHHPNAVIDKLSCKLVCFQHHIVDFNIQILCLVIKVQETVMHLKYINLCLNQVTKAGLRNPKHIFLVYLYELQQGQWSEFML